MADLTFSLKLALGWIYYGDEGYATRIEHAFEVAFYFISLIQWAGDFVLVSEDPPSCLQCKYVSTLLEMGIWLLTLPRTRKQLARSCGDLWLRDLWSIMLLGNLGAFSLRSLTTVPSRLLC